MKVVINQLKTPKGTAATAEALLFYMPYLIEQGDGLDRLLTCFFDDMHLDECQHLFQHGLPLVVAVLAYQPPENAHVGWIFLTQMWPYMARVTETMRFKSFLKEALIALLEEDALAPLEVIAAHVPYWFYYSNEMFFEQVLLPAMFECLRDTKKQVLRAAGERLFNEMLALP